MPLPTATVLRIAQLDERFLGFDNRSIPKEEFLEIAELATNRQEIVPIGQMRRFAIDETRALGIDIVGANASDDLVATLYSYDGSKLTLVELDDDSGQGFNPRLEFQAPQGTYVITLASYDLEDSGLASVYINVL